MGTYTFRLPDIGEGIAEAEIVAWHVAVGDVVAENPAEPWLQPFMPNGEVIQGFETLSLSRRWVTLARAGLGW